MKAETTNQNSPSSGNQNDLIEACKRGDHKAQLQVYKMYYKPVYNLCLGIVNDPAVAEDILHESFLDAFENITSYCGDTSFSSWLSSFIRYNV
jgi:RNA polymerase sigma-70 factor (ECF subfamily)